MLYTAAPPRGTLGARLSGAQGDDSAAHRQALEAAGLWLVWTGLCALLPWITTRGTGETCSGAASTPPVRILRTVRSGPPPRAIITLDRKLLVDTTRGKYRIPADVKLRPAQS